MSVAETNPNTGEPYKLFEVAKLFNINPCVVSTWRKNAKAIFDHNAQQNGKKRRMRIGNFPEVEDALCNYMHNVMAFMRGESIFRDTGIVAKAISLRDEMLIKLNTKLNAAEPGTGEFIKLENAINRMKPFRASSGWAQAFKARKGIDSRRGIGEGGFLIPEEIENARLEVRRQVCTTSIYDLMNTDEIGVLYRSFPSRALRPGNATHSYKRVKDRLTAVLTIFADGTKAPLTIIGKSRRAKSFPRRFNVLRELNVFQMTQKNAWNTKQIWERTVNGFDTMGRLEGRKLKAVLDNCSAHLIKYEHENYKACLLPPNLTSHLRPVDACVGRSFRCIYRRLICRHMLGKVDELLKIPEENRPVYKLTQLLTIYEAFRMMARAWDEVPKRVVLKSWLKSGILAPHQIREVLDLLETAKDTVEPAMPTRYNTALPSDLDANKIRATCAKRMGESWLHDQSEPDPYVEDDEDEVFNNSTTLTDEDLEDLRDLPFIGNISQDDLEKVLLEETHEPVMEPLDEGTAMNHAVEKILDTFNVGDVNTEHSDIEQEDEELRSNNVVNNGQSRFVQYIENM